MRNCEPYSPIMHIAMALHFGRWRDTPLAMLTAYFDASGQEHDQPVVVVAGWVQTAKTWCEFEKEWKSCLLEKYEVPYLHMKEFAHSNGPFKKWKDNEPKRQSFLNDAIEIIKKHGCWSFVIAVDSDDFNEVVREQGMEKIVGNAYLFAVRACLSDISGWCKKHYMDSPEEYIFEKGDPKQGLLREVMEEDGLPEPIFKNKLDEDPHRAVVPLQASDLLAYEVSKGYKTLIGEEDTGFRWALKKMDRSVSRTSWGIYTRENLSRLLPISDFAHKLEAIVEKFEES